MKKNIMSIFTRTPLHVGAGNSVGAVDAPVMRERHTDIPIIPGSSLKGVFADLWNENGERGSEGRWLFGAKDAKSAGQPLFGEMTPDGRLAKAYPAKDAKSAGQLLFGEARVLAFPVRSAKGIFAWITCPFALQRYARETQNKDLTEQIEKMESLEGMQCWATDFIARDGKVLLEEYCLEKQENGKVNETAKILKAMLPLDNVWASVTKRLVVVTDELFSFFVKNACEVVTRIGIDDEKGTVKNGELFCQEQVPSETMLYAVIGDSGLQREKDALATFKKMVLDEEAGPRGLLQIGGDETVGLGICSINLI